MAKEATARIADTPEFKEAVASIREELMAELKSTMATAPGAAGGDTEHFFRQMALAIAEISDQGTNRKRVAPEVLAARETAKKRMGEMILEARKLPQEKRPKYRLVAKVYLKERIVDPFQRLADKRTVPTEIVWTGAPNEGMRPVNASAKAIYAEFLKWIGSTSSAELSGVPSRPLWVTDAGLVIAGAAPRSSRSENLGVPGPLTLDDDLPQGGNGAVDDDDEFKIVSQDDPRAPAIHVLGTIAPPARRVVPTV